MDCDRSNVVVCENVFESCSSMKSGRYYYKILKVVVCVPTGSVALLRIFIG
jgi:hypothetical protein